MRAVRRLSLLVAMSCLVCRAVAAPPPANDSLTIGPRPLDQCIADLESTDVLTRLHGAREIARHGKGAAAAVAPLLRALDAQEPPVRKAAVTALTESGEAVLPPLLRQLPSLSPPGAEAALQVIINLRDAASPETAAVVWSLSASSDENVVRLAGETLGKLGPKAGELGPQLVKVAFDDAQLTAASADAARRALRSLGAEFYRALPSIAQRLREPTSGETLLNIEDVMGAVYPQAPPDKEQDIVPALVELARHPSQRVHWHAMHRLARLGVRAKAAVPELEKIARDPNASGRARYEAVRCLTKIVGLPGAQSIFELYEVESPAVRAAIVVGLVEVGRALPEVRERLELLSADEEHETVRALAKRALEAVLRSK